MRGGGWIMLGGTALLAGCSVAPRPTAAPPTPPMPAAGLGAVMGRTAAQLTALLGEPAQDLALAPARRLQFAGAACVLDAYLYPPRAGGEPVVTYIDARLPNGEDFDRASCVAALARRRR